MRRIVPLGLCLLLAGLLAGPVVAQNTASLSGIVTDSRDGDPLAGANVLLLNPATGATQTGVATDARGHFSMQNVTAGSYTLVVRYIGYQEYRMPLSLSAGESRTVSVALNQSGLTLDQLVITASRAPEKVLDAPASISILTARDIEHEVAPSSDALLRFTPGVDIAQTGIDRREVVLRGFNNAFSGAAYVVTDYRKAAVPSLAVNMFSIMPNMTLDIDRIEVVRGPGSALYGAGADGGVIHYLTKDPFTYPGTSVALSGGERSMFAGQLRHAGVVAGNIGYKVTANYARADDWHFDWSNRLDSLELDKDFKYLDPSQAPTWQNLDPATGRLLRNYDYEKFNVNGLVEYRFDDRTRLTINGGHSGLTGIVLSGIGTLQGHGFGYSYGQVRFNAGDFFAQAYVNRNDAGNSYVYGTGQTVVDKGMLYAAQAQYNLALGDRVNMVVGADAEITAPNTDGTIIGRHEGETIDLYGLYAQTTTALTGALDLTVALRGDYSNIASEFQLSPRAAVVYKINPGNSVRLTYNRAFSPPGTNSLFLDIEGQRTNLAGPFNLIMQARGAATGFTFDNYRATNTASFLLPVPGFFNTSVNLGHVPLVPVYGAAAAGLVPYLGSAAPLPPGMPALTAQQRGLLAQLLGYTAQQGSLGASTTGAVALGIPDATSATGFRSVTGPTDVHPLKPTISQSIETGYKGLLANRLLVAVDVYYAEKQDFVGPLQIESPFAYLQGAGLSVDVGTSLGQLFGTTNDATIQHLLNELNNSGLPPNVVAGILAGLVGGALANQPTAIIQPDQPVLASSDPNHIAGFLAYRNYGQVQYFGSDIALQFLASDRLSLFGNMSWVSDDFFDNVALKEDDVNLAVALNAPTFKARSGFQYSVPGEWTLNAAARFTKGFPVRSGPYVGDVEDRFLLDVGGGYDLSRFVPGMRFDLSIQNLLDNQQREFIGAPRIGRMAMARVVYTM
jgi:outer membrane receptor for ferrienterochelin and colicins